MSAVSDISYTLYKDPETTLEVAFVQNTIANLGGTHMEIIHKATGASGLTLELPPLTARWVSLGNTEQAKKFESEPMKQKYQLQVSTKTPEVMDFKPETLKRLQTYQQEAIDVLDQINEMCIKAMWEHPKTLKKQKATIRKTLEKQGVPPSEIEKKAYIAFLHGGQTGLCSEEGVHDIKTKCAAYRRSKTTDGEFEVRVPRLLYKGEQVDFDATPINRGAVICAQIRVKPYVTPNGAYGTTYIYVNGNLIKNGPEYSSTAKFTDWESIMGVDEVDEVDELDEIMQPPTKRKKVEH